MEESLTALSFMTRFRKGYDGKRSILRDYVHPFRPPAQSTAVRRYETKPGEQAQMDWESPVFITS